MRHVYVMISAGIALVILATLVVFQASAARSAMPLACGSWKAVTSPNAGDGAELMSLTALSSNDVWSVGDFDAMGHRHTLTEHWNGKSWQIVSSPDGQKISNQLYGVAAVSAKDVWAVGFYHKDLSSTSTLIEHWDGIRWSIIASPNTSSPINFLNAVTVVSTSDVWAVGTHEDSINGGGAVFHSLIEHWDGTQWSIVASPDPGNGGNTLASVAATASNNVWAVGSHTSNSGPQQSLIERWNGSTWTVVSSPNAGAFSSLESVNALSAKDIWAVGSQSTGNNNNTLIEHWNGSQWIIVASPNKQLPYNVLYGVTAIATNNVWVAGLAGTNIGDYKALLAHWNGSKWSIVASPNPGKFANFLNGIASAPQTQQIWTVGFYQTSQTDIGHTLTETNC